MKITNGIQFNALDCFYDGVYVSTNMDMTVCYQFEGIPMKYQEEGHFGQTQVNLIELLGSLDTGVTVTMVIRNRKEYRPVLEKHLSTMKEQTSFDLLRKEELRKSFSEARAIEQFLFCSLADGGCRAYGRFGNKKLSFLERYLPSARSKPTEMPTDAPHPLAASLPSARLKRNAAHILNGLKGLDFRVKEMSPQEVLNYCYYHLNHTQNPNKFNETVYVQVDAGDVYRSQKSIREQVLESEIDLDVRENKKRYPNCIQVGDKYISVVAVEVLGTLSDAQFYEKLTKILPDDHEYMVTFERIENEKVYELIKRNEGYLNLGQATKHFAGRPDLENQYALHSKQAVYTDGKNYVRDTETFNLRSFKFSISFTIKTDTLSEMQERILLVKKSMSNQDFYDTRIVINNELIVHNYHAFLPGNSHQNCDWIYNNSVSMLFYLPLQAEYKGYDVFNDTAPSNQVYINAKNEIVKYHTFYFESNFKHHECTATTGSGKTYDFNKQIDGIMSEDNPEAMKPVIIAIEPKRGFLKICRFYSGELISYNFSGTKSYNPFFQKRDLYTLHDVNYEGYETQSTKYDPLILDFYVNLVERLSIEERQKMLPPRLKKIIEQLFIDLYDSGDEDYVLILEDLVGKMKGLKLEDEAFQLELNRIRDNLSFYCSDRFRNLFGIREQLNVNSDFLYFDLGSIEGDDQLKNTVMYILSSSIMRKLRTRNRIKYLFIDEASVFHQSEVGAKMIDFFLRLSRSLGGVIILGSQNVSDSLTSLASKTIKNALAVETCMWLKSGHQDLLQIGFNQEEKGAIENLKKKPGQYVELFRKIAGKPMVLRSVSNPYLYWLSTNDPLDDELFLTLSKRMEGEPFHKLIETLAKEYPNGHYTKK